MNKIILAILFSISFVSFSQSSSKFKIKIGNEFVLDTLNYTGDFSPTYSTLEINDCNDFFTSGQPLKLYSFSGFSDSIQFEISDLYDQYGNFEVKSIRYGIDSPLNYIYSNYEESLLYYYEPIVKVPLNYSIGQERIFFQIMVQEVPNILSWYLFKIEKNQLNIKDEHKNLINIFPNPSSDFIIIECPLNSEISVIDSKGQKNINFEIISCSENQTSINIEKLDSGVYFIRVNEKFNKLIKQ